jgi:hypothetical protein
MVKTLWHLNRNREAIAIGKDALWLNLYCNCLKTTITTSFV